MLNRSIPGHCPPSQKSIFISGASSGIGYCCAQTLAELGHQVFAGFRNPTDGEALRTLHPGIIPIPLEVTSSTAIAQAFHLIEEQLQGAGLHGLVNNAGIVISGPLELVPIAEWRHQLDVNLIGQIEVTQRFLPLLRKGRGRIVNMGSVAGINALPFVSPYSASKFALAAITDALRVELKPWGIQVALIEPGSVSTPIWRKARNISNAVQHKLPEDLRQLYASALNLVEQASKQSESRGIPPEVVARAVVHALTAPRPKTRYTLGKNALWRRPFSWLPDTLRDTLIAAKIGLPTGE
ncbi:SDR family oxidoreductase [Vampirovibrio sp.]|uniref:SDR family oxidoreductase n=1 Tax=Vampirovibrio sp. TaxID=2717857 RepID=UPI00359307D1